MKTEVHVRLHDDVLDGVMDLLGGDPTMGAIHLWVNRACRGQLKRSIECSDVEREQRIQRLFEEGEE